MSTPRISRSMRGAPPFPAGRGLGPPSGTICCTVPSFKCVPAARDDESLTSSSPSKDEDSFRKTAMSRREDILGCIDVTIMDRSANTAPPSSHSKTFPAFRAGAAVTHTAGLGGKGFVDFLEPHACVSALFIRQHGSERTPPRIEHGPGLSGLRHSGSVHVANEQSTVAVDQNSGRSRTVHASSILKEGAHACGKKTPQTYRNARCAPLSPLRP